MEATAWLCCEPLPPVRLHPGVELKIGRLATCDVVLPHCSVSRTHARLCVTDKGVTVKDQMSSNGTFVNGDKIGPIPVELHLNDVVSIGPYEAFLRNSPTELANTGALVLSSGGFSMVGHLSKTSLAEVFQGIEFNEKTGTLHIKGKHSGLLVFKSGKPIAAKLDAYDGSEAIMQMLSLKDGSFMVSDTAETFAETIKHSFTRILLDYAREADER